MRFFPTFAIVLGLLIGNAAHAQPRDEIITRAFMDICLKNAPRFQSHKVKPAFETVLKSRLPAGISAVLTLTPAKSCGINFRPVPLNADGSKADVPLELEKAMMADLAKRVQGELSVYRQGRPWESWSVKVGKERYDLSSAYKKGQQSWSITLSK